MTHLVLLISALLTIAGYPLTVASLHACGEWRIRGIAQHVAAFGLHTLIWSLPVLGIVTVLAVTFS